MHYCIYNDIYNETMNRQLGPCLVHNFFNIMTQETELMEEFKKNINNAIKKMESFATSDKIVFILIQIKTISKMCIRRKYRPVQQIFKYFIIAFLMYCCVHISKCNLPQNVSCQISVLREKGPNWNVFTYLLWTILMHCQNTTC